MVSTSEKPILTVDTVAEWETYLSSAPDPHGVRLRLRKKATTLPGITYDEALDVALCFGWIDGQVKSLDAHYFLQVFTPRRPRSVWSQRNREHIARLTEEGRMRPGGVAEVEKAMADGRWDAAYRQKDAVVPDDLQAALDADPAAARFFGTLTAQNRWAILFRLHTLVRPETRTARIATYVDMLARRETLYPQGHLNPQGEPRGD